MTAAASALGDSYCSLAWGGKLGKASDAAVAAGVLNGSDAGLTDQEKAMAAWARKVARDPNATTPSDIQALRDSGPVLPGQVAERNRASSRRALACASTAPSRRPVPRRRPAGGSVLTARTAASGMPSRRSHATSRACSS